MPTKYATRLTKIQAQLPAPRVNFHDWVMGKPQEQQIMMLRFYFYIGQLIDAGIDPHGEEFQKELQPHESLVTAICRLCELDYRTVLTLLEEWRQIA